MKEVVKPGMSRREASEVLDEKGVGTGLILGLGPGEKHE